MSNRRPYIGPSEQNSQALYQRDSPYEWENRKSARNKAVRILPTGLPQLFRWFMKGWVDEVKGQMHADGIEVERPGVIVRGDGSREADPGGGNWLGAPAFDDETRQHLFGRLNRTDEDGSYVEPMHWTVQWMSFNQHPLKAAVLRMIGRGGDWRHGVTVTCSTCTSSVTLPDEYAEAIARDALTVAYKSYEDVPIGMHRIA